MSKLYTAQQVADLIDMNVSTVQKWANAGDIPNERIDGRYVIGEDGLDAARLLSVKPRQPPRVKQKPQPITPPVGRMAKPPVRHALTPRYQTMEESGLGWLKDEWEERQSAILARTVGR